MTIPRDVVLDLLPLYVAGEVSPATRAFVEQELARDPALAAEMQALRQQDLGDALAAVAAPRPEIELQSLRKTRRLLGLQKWLFGFAIAFTSMALAIDIPFRNGRVGDVHLMLRDYPVPFGTAAILGIALWIAYYRLRRKLRTTAL